MDIHPPDHEETCFVSLAATSCHRFPSAALGEEYMLKSAWSEVLGLEHFWLLVIFILRDKQVAMRQDQVKFSMH